jgi:hypothetical protein
LCCRQQHPSGPAPSQSRQAKRAARVAEPALANGKMEKYKSLLYISLNQFGPLNFMIMKVLDIYIFVYISICHEVNFNYNSPLFLSHLFFSFFHIPFPLHFLQFRLQRERPRRRRSWLLGFHDERAYRGYRIRIRGGLGVLRSLVIIVRHLLLGIRKNNTSTKWNLNSI